MKKFLFKNVEIPMIPAEMLLLLFFLLEMVWKMVLNNEGFFSQFKIQKMRKMLFGEIRKYSVGWQASASTAL